MRKSQVVPFLIILAATVLPAYSQLKFSGKVADVLDGRTVVLELESGRLTATLQYIDTPAPEQPLSQAVKEHLARLVLGRQIEFQPKGIFAAKTLGTLYLKGKDVGQQMVRDGAAWHIPAERTGQEAADSRAYNANEMQARSEKRGVWSIAELKPAWEFRAVKEENERRRKIDDWSVYLGRSKQQAETSRGKSQAAGERQSAPETAGIWPDLDGKTAASAKGLVAGYDAEKKEGFTAAPESRLELNSPAGQRFSQAMDLRAVYAYRGDPNRIEDSIYIIGLLSRSPEQKFAAMNGLSVTVDRDTFEIGAAKRLMRPIGSDVQELLLYKIEPFVMKRIAAGKKVTVRVGRFYGSMLPAQDALKQLLELTD